MSYRLIEGETWFTGTSWLLSILAQNYERFRVFILAHNFQGMMANDLYGAALNRMPRKNQADIELVVRSHNDDSPEDIRGKRKKHGNYAVFANIRNMVLDYVLNPENFSHEFVDQVDGFDYFVSIDSDVMVHEDMVRRLVEYMERHTEVGLCGVPVNNTRRLEMDLHYPDAVFNFGYIKSKGETIQETSYEPAGRLPGTGNFPADYFAVDYVGAACIMRLALLRGHSDIRYDTHRQGEDFPFCFAMQKTGAKIMVDGSQVTLHMMDPRVYESDLEAFMNRERI